MAEQAGTEQEIEVTPEMVSEAVGILLDFEPQWGDTEETAIAVYRAMEKARRRQNPTR